MGGFLGMRRDEPRTQLEWDTEMEQPNSFTHTLMWVSPGPRTLDFSENQSPVTAGAQEQWPNLREEQGSFLLRTFLPFAHKVLQFIPSSSFTHPTSCSEAGVHKISGRESPGCDWIKSTSICFVLETRGRCQASAPDHHPPHNIQLPPKGFLSTLSIPTPSTLPTPPQDPPDACRAHPHLSSRLLMSLSSLLAAGTSLLVRVREISVLLSWESTRSTPLSPRLATLSPVRAERALLAVLGSRGLTSHAQSNPAQASCKESVPMSTLLPSG